VARQQQQQQKITTTTTPTNKQKEETKPGWSVKGWWSEPESRFKKKPDE
jgi:hypothetical protein